MSAVLLISSVLIGLLVGRITHFQLPGNFVEIVLYALIFVVGIDLSKEKIEKRFVKDIALIIVSTVGGTLVFAYILSLLYHSIHLKHSWRHLDLVGTAFLL